MKRSKEYAGDAEQQQQTNESGVRTTGRVKKPKTVFDPSDNYLSRAQRASVAASTPEQTSPPALLSPASSATNSLNTSIAICSDDINTVANNNNNNGETPLVDYGKGFDTCTKCLITEPKRGQGFKSKFLQCRTCIKKWHINCIKIQFECYRLARDKYRCEICRTCCVCSRNKNSQPMPKNKELFMCTLCVDAYHADCHKPSISKSQVIDGSFKCSKCESVPPDYVGGKAKKDVRKRSKTPDARTSLKSSDKSISSLEIPAHAALPPPPPPPPPAPVEEIKELKLATDIKSIQKWSVDDVVSFFTKYHPNEAHVFMKHEIDGASLLLLKRNQILKRFNLKMGPSLRVYETVVILQTQDDNIMNAWND